MIDELRKLEAKVRAAKVVPGGLVQMPHDFGLDDLRALQALIRQQAGGDGGRTAPDYAIEFGIYLADAVKKYMHAREDYESAVESEAEDQDACGDVMTDHWMAMQSAVYEFLKRAQRAAAAPTQPPAPGDELRAMLYAPRDGTEIEILVRHPSYYVAQKVGSTSEKWEGFCVAKWIDHNGGGWTWSGHYGTPEGWRELAKDNGNGG